MRRLALALSIVVAATLTGCAQYQAPGGPADFAALGITQQEQAAMTDADIRVAMDRKPAASFPARIATVRLQDRQYESYTYGERTTGGRYAVVPATDLEQTEDVKRMLDLPMLAGVAPLNRLVMPEGPSSMKDLRRAAANVQADMVLIYTVDTRFGVENKIPALGVFTLGLFPNDEARVSSQVLAALVDTRTGFIYGLAQGAGNSGQLTNAWSSDSAVEQSRRKAERAAFTAALDQFELLWTGIASSYAMADTASAADPVESQSADSTATR
jgi:hypothetical protein